MDLRRVRYFVAVADSLHFGRAAERMNVVQSAISQQLRLLEDELGVGLLERDRHNVQLTDSGRLFLVECRLLLSQAEKAKRVARNAASGVTGHITVGFVDNALWLVLPTLLRSFHDQHIGVELTLQPVDRSAQVRGLEDRTIDVALIPSPAPSGEYETDSFVQAPLVAALPLNHPMARLPVVSLEGLADEPFVLFPLAMGSRLLEIVHTACAAACFRPRVAQEARQMHTLLALVSAGLGVTLVPRWVAMTHVPNVIFRPISTHAVPYELVFAWRREPTSGVLTRFLAVANHVSETITAALLTADLRSDLLVLPRPSLAACSA